MPWGSAAVGLGLKRSVSSQQASITFISSHPSSLPTQPLRPWPKGLKAWLAAGPVTAGDTWLPKGHKDGETVGNAGADLAASASASAAALFTWKFAKGLKLPGSANTAGSVCIVARLIMTVSPASSCCLLLLCRRV